MTIIAQKGDWENDTVTIPVDEYITLQQEVKFLRYLESHGVDSWEGYEMAIESWRNGD